MLVRGSLIASYYLLKIKKETLRKRFKSYEEIQFPIIDYYIKNGLCEEIKTEGTRDENILKINNLMKSKNLLP